MERQHSPRRDRKTDHSASKGEERTPRARFRPPPRGGKGLETSHGREPNAQKARGVKVILLAPRNGKN